jgi:hypothetical protein
MDFLRRSVRGGVWPQRVSVPELRASISRRSGRREAGPGGESVVLAACRSECLLMCRGMPADFAIRATIRYAADFEDPRDGTVAAWCRACCPCRPGAAPATAQGVVVVLSVDDNVVFVLSPITFDGAEAYESQLHSVTS